MRGIPSWRSWTFWWVVVVLQSKLWLQFHCVSGVAIWKLRTMKRWERSTAGEWGLGAGTETSPASGTGLISGERRETGALSQATRAGLCTGCTALSALVVRSDCRGGGKLIKVKSFELRKITIKAQVLDICIYYIEKLCTKHDFVFLLTIDDGQLVHTDTFLGWRAVPCAKWMQFSKFVPPIHFIMASLQILIPILNASWLRLVCIRCPR